MGLFQLDVLEFLAAPFVMCLLLVGIHCYLGMHVLARGVVFVDLSLAQVASLGAICALLIDSEPHSRLGYFVSLSLTLLFAALFATGRRLEKQISQEALIGITYAFSSAAVVLVVGKLAHGAEHLREALVGQILWVTWLDVVKTALIYSIVGAIHWIYRRQFWASSLNEKDSHWFWDFLFYGLFGVVITSSTAVAGVLLVFAFLIVPAVLSTLLAPHSSLKARLVFGWVFGAVLSLIGMWLSYQYDLPVGAILVVIFTAGPLLAMPYLYFKRRA